MNLNRERVAATIDHTYLGPEGGREVIKRLCNEACGYGFACVTLAPYYVPLAVKRLQSSGVGVAAVVGFPLGFDTTETKREAARGVFEAGADEIDMVVNIAAVRDGDWDYVGRELNELATLGEGRVVKAIFEACYLDEGQIVRLCHLCVEAGVDYAKTSTGFGTGGATPATVRLIRETAGDRLRIKAAGGIRTREDYLAMRRAGADRIGTSSGVEIVRAF